MSSKLILLFCMVGAGTNVACVAEPAGIASATVSENVVESNQDISRAGAIIARMPESPLGYTQLAAAYIRRARETSDFELNSEAESAVNRALEIAPEDVNARKLEASLHLTFHRFADGLEAGKRLQGRLPNDPFVYGILADANAELGNYSEAIEAAQKMVDLRPDTASYARAGHLRSLHGDHGGAIEMYGLAAKVSDPADREAQAWCLVQLGNELWSNGKYDEASRVYERALELIPGYKIGVIGKARAMTARNDLNGAAELLKANQSEGPEPDISILLSQIAERQNDPDKAGRLFAEGEAAERKNLGVPGEQKHLATLWADYDINLADAQRIAEEEYGRRKDIYTADALAWCRFKNGRFAEAKELIGQAMRLNTRDARIFYHAGMIEKALGKKREARQLLKRALQLNPAFDLRQAEIAKKALAELNA